MLFEVVLVTFLPLFFFLWRVKKEGERGEGRSKNLAFVNVEGERLKRNGSGVRVLLMINRRLKEAVLVRCKGDFCVLPDK